jgi:DNA-directed RNA polymerase subunit RPC12/RpoP
VQKQTDGLVVSSMVNVDSWKILLRCPKCGIENEVTLGQIKRGESIQCIVCATKINLKDKNGRVAKGTKKVQDAVVSLEKTVKKIGGSLKLK